MVKKMFVVLFSIVALLTLTACADDVDELNYPHFRFAQKWEIPTNFALSSEYLVGYPRSPYG